MQANQLLSADLLDIIFDGKNKAYGAYQLRKTYNSRLINSLLITIGIAALLYLSNSLQNNKPILSTPPLITDTLTLILEPIKNNEEPIPIDPPAPKLPEDIQTIKSTTIQILPDEKVRKEDIPPPVDELENAKIATFTQEGVINDVPGPIIGVADGVGKGLIDAPAKGAGNGNDNDGGFIPIEMESEYPGGPKAWSRFLNRTLGNNYPPEAVEQRIQGTVVIQFIVDIDGSVSDVKAISGPEILHDAAITTIKKSGKWKPALQNGRNVKTYKKQPITFLLQD